MNKSDCTDHIDERIKAELKSYIDELPVRGKQIGWKRIENELYPHTKRALLSLKLSRLAGVAVFLMFILGFVCLPHASARVSKFLKTFNVKLPGPVANLVMVVSPDEQSKIPDRSGNKIESSSLEEIIFGLDFTPLVIPEHTKDWSLVDGYVDDADDASSLILHYKDKNKNVITLAQEKINSFQSESLFYDVEDSHLTECQVRNASVKIISYKNGYIRAWWAESEILFSLTGPISSDDAVKFIKNLRPY